MTATGMRCTILRLGKEAAGLHIDLAAVGVMLVRARDLRIGVIVALVARAADSRRCGGSRYGLTCSTEGQRSSMAQGVFVGEGLCGCAPPVCGR